MHERAPGSNWRGCGIRLRFCDQAGGNWSGASRCACSSRMHAASSMTFCIESRVAAKSRTQPKMIAQTPVSPQSSASTIEALATRWRSGCDPTAAPMSEMSAAAANEPSPTDAAAAPPRRVPIKARSAKFLAATRVRRNLLDVGAGVFEIARDFPGGHGAAEAERFVVMEAAVATAADAEGFADDGPGGTDGAVEVDG